MADENTPITDVVQDVGNQDGQSDVTKKDTSFRDDTLGFIKSVQKTQEDNVDKGVKDVDTENVEVGKEKLYQLEDYSRLAGNDIPDAFSDAAEKAGMTPTEIVKYANVHSDEELLELVPQLLGAVEPESEPEPEPEPEPELMVDSKLDPDVVTEITNKISKQLEEKFGATLKDIETFKAHQEEQSTLKMVETVSKKFDETFKEFPVFGKTEELPKFPSGKLAGHLVSTSPAVKARLEVLRYADAFMKMGANIDNAMDDALATYKGKHLTKEMERRLVKDLKGHESKLSGARIGKETTKKYVDTREEIIDEIRQLQKAHGLEP